MSRQSRTGSRREGFLFRPDPAGRYRRLWPGGYFADFELLTRSTRLDSLAVDAGDEANRHAALDGITAGQDLQDRCGHLVADGAQQAFQAGKPGWLVRLIEEFGDRSGLVRSALVGQPLAALRQGIANLEADRTARPLECRLESGDRRGSADLPQSAGPRRRRPGLSRRRGLPSSAPPRWPAHPKPNALASATRRPSSSADLRYSRSLSPAAESGLLANPPGWPRPAPAGHRQ